MMVDAWPKMFICEGVATLEMSQCAILIHHSHQKKTKETLKVCFFIVIKIMVKNKFANTTTNGKFIQKANRVTIASPKELFVISHAARSNLSCCLIAILPILVVLKSSRQVIFWPSSRGFFMFLVDTRSLWLKFRQKVHYSASQNQRLQLIYREFCLSLVLFL